MPMGINIPGEAQLHVYPVAGLDEMYAGQVSALQQLLADRPADPAGPLPLLPPVNAAQQFVAQVEYLEFGNGAGVRYLTALSQGLDPVANDRIFYTFQGLTADGAAYVAAFFPVAAADLPATAAEALAAPEVAAVLEGGDHAAYLAGVVQGLNGADPAAFDPELSRLDAWIATLVVSAGGEVAQPPELPALGLVGPADAAEVSPTPVLEWQPFAGATTYQVVVVTGFPPEVVFETTTAETTVAVAPALAGRDLHYWTVWAKDAAGENVASLSSSFMVVE
jgi:hypothetical protein